MPSSLSSQQTISRNSSWLHGLLLTVALFLAMAASGNVQADDWPRFRGLNGDGNGGSIGLKPAWPETDAAWKHNLPGEGHSSPIIIGDRLFVTAADEAAGTRWLICLDAMTGSELWRRPNRFVPYRKHKNNSFASSTPCADDSAVYQLWQSREESQIVAYRFDGEELWSTPLPQYSHGQGGAASPIVADGRVIIANDQSDKAQSSALLAFDARTGDQLWRIPRAGSRACYATPCVFTDADGRQQVVFSHSFEGVTGVNPKDGEILWMVKPFGTHSQRALGSVITVGRMVLASSGAGGGDRHVVALIPPDEGQSEPTEVWRIEKTPAPHVPTPLVHGKRVYLWSDGGIVTSADAETGDEIWKGRIRGQYFSSPIYVDGMILNMSSDGEVAMISADDEFQQLGIVPLNETSRASPAVANGRLYLRTLTQVICIDPAGA